MSFEKRNLPETIKCENNFRLKAVSLNDSDYFLKIISENQEHFSQFDFVSPAFSTLPEVIEVIKNLNQYQTDLAGVSYGFWSESKLLGLFTINRIDWTNQVADIGFWLIQGATNQGFASIGLKALTQCCWNTLELKSLTAHTAVSNIKCQKLLLKFGFKKIDTLKGHFKVRGLEIDEYLYCLHRPVRFNP